MSAQPAKTYLLSVVFPPASDNDSEFSGQDSRAVCAICYGTGREVVAGKAARRCRCRTEERQSKLFAAENIPRRYGRCSFASYPLCGNGTHLP
jgi:hypothetical protein